MSQPQRYRKRPVVIEAWQLPPATPVTSETIKALTAIAVWCDGFITADGVAISTLEGTMTAAPGDWVIKGVQGEFYPCKPEIFAATYEPAPEVTA